MVTLFGNPQFLSSRHISTHINAEQVPKEPRILRNDKTKARMHGKIDLAATKATLETLRATGLTSSGPSHPFWSRSGRVPFG